MVKTAPKQNTLDTSNFLPALLIIGYLCVGFIPNLDAVDKIAPPMALFERFEFILWDLSFALSQNF